MTTAELDALAHRIAYSSARSDIERYVEVEHIATGPSRAQAWYDLRQATPDWIDEIQQAAAYLSERGLLIHHEAAPHLVRIRPEKEAAR